MVETFPNGNDEWGAISKDHGVSSVGSVRIWLIELPIHPTGWWADLGAHFRSGPGAWASTGQQLDVLSNPASEGWAVSSIGGRATYSGAGRMLQTVRLDNPWDPFNNIAVSSDAFWQSAGTTYATSLSIAAQ